LQAHLDFLAEDGEEVPSPKATTNSTEPDKFYSDEKADYTLVTVYPPSRQVRVNISIQDRTLALLDDMARSSGLTRSGMIAAMINERQ
jgi:hypothetical protein